MVRYECIYADEVKYIEVKEPNKLMDPESIPTDQENKVIKGEILYDSGSASKTRIRYKL